MKYYYANAANQPTGPVSLEELRDLVARSEISATTNIIPVGETVWRPLSTILPPPAGQTPLPSSAPAPEGLTSFPIPHGVRPAPASALKPTDVTKLPTFLAAFIGVLIEKARAALSIPRLTALFTHAAAVGQLLVLAGAAFALIYGIVYAIKYDSFEIFLYGLASVLLLAVLQFVAKRMLEACASILKTSPTRVASVAILDCFALLLLLGAGAALVHGVIAAIQLETAVPLIPAVVAAVIFTAAAGVALHPSLALVTESPSSAGEEAIGLFSFFAKSTLVLQPLLFCVYAAAGLLVILFALFGRDAAFAGALLAFVPFEIPGAGGVAGTSIIATACAFPLFAYLSFLAYYLLIDVLRAILSIPGKLDQLRR